MTTIELLAQLADQKWRERSQNIEVLG